MRILLTNDDGVYAPGLAAMERVLRQLGEVYVVAPLREQSGVAHSITFLTPLQAGKVYVNDKHWAWAVDGTPADCVKLAISTILPDPPDLVVSGMNGGLNSGLNVLYSGTVAAAVEGALYGITSIAVSLQSTKNAPFQQAADLALGIIEKIWKQNTAPGRLYSINIPIEALKQDMPEVKVVPVNATECWETYERRMDTVGRPYYWLAGSSNPRQATGTPSDVLTDSAAILQGYITVTPLSYDLTDEQRLREMSDWQLSPQSGVVDNDVEHTGPRLRVCWRS
ncbi:MAG: 5'/3'-nucleotidase SurE [Planctomycetaceae bacterium]|nr:5'/3'-nucleotidase SurE [Planctomycetaceae bacterium]